MHKVILDCDNAIGIRRSDIDDGLTFLYLYGHPDVELLGLTTTFANNILPVIYHNTLQFFEDLGIGDVPVLRGGRDHKDLDSEASRFLVEQANKHPGEIELIATGSLVNVYSAYLLDNRFFEKLKGIYIMGGILEPLYLNGYLVRELNFSAAPKAAFEVFKHARNITLLSSQTTSQARFTEKEVGELYAQNTNLSRYLKPIIEDWMDFLAPRYKQRCFHNWDLVAAIAVTNPEMYETTSLRVAVVEENFTQGLLPPDPSGKELLHPVKIRDLDVFNREFIHIIKLTDEKCSIRYYPDFLL